MLNFAYHSEERFLRFSELLGENTRQPQWLLHDPVAVEFGKLFAGMAWTRKRAAEWKRLRQKGVYDLATVGMLRYCVPDLKAKWLRHTMPLVYALRYAKRVVDREILEQWWTMY